MLEVKREFIATITGAQTVLVPKEIKQETSILFCCDGPRCEARNGKPLRLSWIEEEAVEDTLNLPNEFFTIIKLQPSPTEVEKVYYFCGASCCRDWLIYSYVPPKTAKQLRDEAAQMKLPFESASQVEPSDDATGHSEPVNA